ncbi:MAG: hypothetical protein PVF66_01000 [Candidatus Aminicenantes bacterium]|jgi:hypothetical protein
MIELFNLFEEKEKKALRVVGVLLGVAMLFLLLVSFPQKRSSIRAHSRLESKQGEYQHFNSVTLKKEDEWRQWQEAYRDIDELKKSHFYSGKDAVKKMRLDIQRILSQARIPSTQKKYNYTEFKRENIKKMSMSFNVRGTYQSLKGLIQLVEEFPKFLIVEKIDFLDIDVRSSILELKIVLAGYYES